MNIVIIGAGAAGLFCAGMLGQKGHKVTVVDNGATAGRKLLLAGGGKCNFTNMEVSAANYISSNPHFCKSAIKRFTQWDFISMLAVYGIEYEEREHGQLFCRRSASDILDMLMQECRKGDVRFIMSNTVESVQYEDGFSVYLSAGKLNADKLIVASGGLSLPKIGATPIAYKIAESFNIPVEPVRAGLVPFTLDKAQLDEIQHLSGVSLPVTASVNKKVFREKLLFTHRGLSGPVILQLSNYWTPGEYIKIDLLADIDIDEALKQDGTRHVKTVLAEYMPKSLAEYLVNIGVIADTTVNRLTIAARQEISENIHNWEIKPNGTEGYRTAEVTLGGVDTNHLSSKTMAATSNEHLYFIGEAVDVSGQLGGYNLQWCWSSAWACADGINSN